MIFRARFFYWIIFSLGVWFAGHFGEWPWANLLMFFLILLPILSLISGLIRRSRINISVLRQDAFIERGQPAYWHFQVESKNLMADNYLYASYQRDVRSEVEYLNPFPLKARESMHLGLEIPSIHTGPLQPYAIEMRMLDPMGFFNLPLSSFRADAFDPVLVLPRSLIAILEKDDSQAYLEEGESMSKKSDFDLDEIDLIRPMRPGDNRRDIHWKLSARMQAWMVRQYEKADENELFFLFNLPHIDFNDTNFDYALYLRDLVLDHVSEAAQSFLSQEYVLNLRLRRPWKDQVRIESLAEYETVRIGLASLPYEINYSFAQELREEQLEGLKAFYCVFTSELDSEITSELLVLASQAQGILLWLIHPEASPPREWKPLIQRLAGAGVRVSLNRRPQGIRS